MSTEVTINNIDVEKEYGLILPNLSDVLLTLPAVKEPIQNESRLLDGIQVIFPEGNIKLASRDFTIEMGIKAPNRAVFINRYDAVIALFMSGWLHIKTTHIPGKTFRCRYVSCTQFTNYNSRLAKFVLKLNEPNPANRS